MDITHWSIDGKSLSFGISLKKQFGPKLLLALERIEKLLREGNNFENCDSLPTFSEDDMVI